MGRKKKLVIMTAVCCGIALLVAGAASATFGVVGDDPTETTESTTTTTLAPEPTDEPPTSDTLAPDAEEPGDEEGSFGSIISALRQEGDHTPAAIIMGKDVPGWDPEKHPGSVTDITAYPPGHDEDGGDGDDGDEEVTPEGSSDGSGNSHSQNAKGHRK